MTTTIEEYFDMFPVTGGRKDVYNRDILEQIIHFNYHYGLCVKMSTVVYLLNIVFSGISIYTYSYVGNKTATSFASNVLLLLLLIGKGIYITHKTVTSESIVAISGYKQDYISFNGVNDIRAISQLSSNLKVKQDQSQV